jgi:hypothetical protein
MDDRIKLREIFNLDGRKVSESESHDYAIDFTPQEAALMRRNSYCSAQASNDALAKIFYNFE